MGGSTTIYEDSSNTSFFGEDLVKIGLAVPEHSRQQQKNRTATEIYDVAFACSERRRLSNPHSVAL